MFKKKGGILLEYPMYTIYNLGKNYQKAGISCLLSVQKCK